MVKELIEIDNQILEKKTFELIECIEDQPDEWYKLLVERLVKQEMTIDILINRINNLEKFEKINSVIVESGLLKLNSNLKLRYEVKAMSSLLPDEGFYNIEKSKNNTVYRWTKQNFYFDVPISRENTKKIHLYLLSASKLELLDTMSCFADGMEIFLEKDLTQKGHVFVGILPETTSSTSTRLAFQAVSSYVPKELNREINDNRDLAVTFSKLIVE